MFTGSLFTMSACWRWFVVLSCRSPGPSGGQSKKPMDKKLRRQIANCNERRRMQSINAGFHTLRVLMPHLQGEKMSKVCSQTVHGPCCNSCCEWVFVSPLQAAVLQHAAEHIFRLNQERERLLQQNTSLRMMLSKYWPNSDPGSVDQESQDGKVNKATSPLCFDDERAASRELEQIFATQKEVDRIKAELERERSRRISLEARLKDRSPSEEDEEEEEDTESDMDEFKHKRPRVVDSGPNSRNNLDIIVRAIRQIEGDAFSRSATPTCGSQERSTGGTFTPISTGDNSRVSPVTPVCASWIPSRQPHFFPVSLPTYLRPCYYCYSTYNTPNCLPQRWFQLCWQKNTLYTVSIQSHLIIFSSPPPFDRLLLHPHMFCTICSVSDLTSCIVRSETIAHSRWLCHASS